VSNVYKNHKAGFYAGVAPGNSVAHAHGLLRTVGARGLCSGNLGTPGKPEQILSAGRLHAGLSEGEIRELVSTNSLAQGYRPHNLSRPLPLDTVGPDFSEVIGW
jgi:hypothetical protein